MLPISRRAIGLCSRSTCASLSNTRVRCASSDSNSHQDDADVYPEESFNTPFWRNTVLFTILGIGIYHLVPYIDKDGTYITRYIQHYSTPSQEWERINDKHLEQSAEAAQGQLLIASATRPRILRMRGPLSFEIGSPHNIAVGSQADVSNVRVKKDNPWE